MRRAFVLLAALCATAAGCSAGASRDAAVPAAPRSTQRTVPPSAPPLPTVMAALGDSMTRAFVLCDGGGGDCPEWSWATGSRLDSHARRLRALGGDAGAHNLAVSGATVASLEAQARRAVATGAGYVTVLIGANDACATGEAAMTPVAEFAAAFERGLATLVRGLPDARVLVVSVPDLLRLWRVGRDDAKVRATWERLGVCRSMLADAASTAPDDAARRGRVRERVVAYNAAMAAACAKHPSCRWDGNAVFEHEWGLDAVSPRDYWHPSRAGQAILADVSWRAGWWA